MTRPQSNPGYGKVLNFWFGGEDATFYPQRRSRLWWDATPQDDELIRREFAGFLEKAKAVEFEDWKRSPRGVLALIILLDQVSRHAFRGRPSMYNYDASAQGLSVGAIEQGIDKHLFSDERAFLYMPLVHAECLVLQERALALFGDVAGEAPPGQSDYFARWLRMAEEHRQTIVRFGRFPHRNEILGRCSTEEEIDFLAGIG